MPGRKESTLEAFTEFEPYLTAENASKILKVALAHVRLCADGKLPSVRLGPRTLRILVAEFGQWLEIKAVEKSGRRSSEAAPDSDLTLTE